jgi:RHS repeat-associated protein
MVALGKNSSLLERFTEVIREDEIDPGANHLYSVAALTDNTGAVVERYRYDTFGNRTVLAPDGVMTRAASSYNQQIGFTGRYLDKETGLWYFRNRYYSGTLGRFIGRDPLGYVDGASLYGSYFVPNQLDWNGLAIRIIMPIDVSASSGKISVRKGFEDYDEKIKNLLQEVVGDCATLTLAPTAEWYSYKAAQYEGFVFAGWYRNPTVTVGGVYHDTSKLGYKNEKSECKCNKCWQLLKAAIDSGSDIQIGWGLDRIRGRTSGGMAGPSTDYADPNNPLVNFNPGDPMGLSKPLTLSNGSAEPNPPASVVLWHEAIGHGHMRKFHHGIPDPTIEIENIARECLRLQGNTGLLDRALDDPNRGHVWDPNAPPESSNR